ncbi:MAG TPA: hypothetical protein VGH23_18555 [Rhizomicrobium sp.]|jgi:hypothetical protein
MCDYSLESFARRDAKSGDQLRTNKIGGYGSIGLVAPDAPKTAVCLRAGTRLIVSGVPTLLQKAWGVREVAIATFEQRDATSLMGLWGRDGRYRDGVRFDDADHRFVLFQEFPVGIEVSVEMIPGVSQGTIQDKTQPELISA